MSYFVLQIFNHMLEFFTLLLRTLQFALQHIVLLFQSDVIIIGSTELGFDFFKLNLDSRGWIQFQILLILTAWIDQIRQGLSYRVNHFLRRRWWCCCGSFNWNYTRNCRVYNFRYLLFVDQSFPIISTFNSFVYKRYWRTDCTKILRIIFTSNNISRYVKGFRCCNDILVLQWRKHLRRSIICSLVRREWKQNWSIWLLLHQRVAFFN